MASIALLKRASNPLNKFIRPIRCVSVSPSTFFRSFNNSAELSDSDDLEGELIEHRRSDDSLGYHGGYAPYPYSSGYVLDPFSHQPRSFNQVLDVIGDYNRNPFFIGGGERRRGWEVNEDESAVYLKVDMPGLGKENVKVSVENSTLVIKGEGEKEDGEDEDSVRRYSSRIDLPEDLFKIGEIKAEMKNGVLRVSVPKVKEEEKKDVVVVTVE